MSRSKRTTVQLLVEASRSVGPAAGLEGWNYGWCLPAYRRSSAAAIDGPHGVVRLSDAGLDAWEDALGDLQADQQITARWDADELAGLLASLTAAAAASVDPAAFLERNVNLLRSTGPMLTVALLANVKWDVPPRAFPDVVLGNASPEFIEVVNTIGANRVGVEPGLATEWLREEVASRADHTEAGHSPVAMACWTTGQGRRGKTETERRLDDVVGLAILLERDLQRYEVHRRGPTNRPGVRGLTLDRGALEATFKERAAAELSYRPLTISEIFGQVETVQWFGPEPLPLGALLEQAVLRGAVEASLTNDPVAARIRAAARWCAEAHTASPMTTQPLRSACPSTRC